MKLALETAKKMMDGNCGSLDLSSTGITSLPENLTVGGWLDLSDTPIKSLPKCLTVGDSLYLSGTPIKSLPKCLTVGGSLYLRGTPIKSLPECLTVGGSLYLRGTGITSKNANKLHNGDYVEGRYLYADGILTHIKTHKTISGYTLFVGKIPGKNVVFDGKNYAHCNKLRDGISDLLFKSACDRGADQYRNVSVDDEMSVTDLVAMYRIITGACQQGSQAFVDSLGNKLKDRYSIREVIALTKGQYGADKFEQFFVGK